MVIPKVPPNSNFSIGNADRSFWALRPVIKPTVTKETKNGAMIETATFSLSNNEETVITVVNNNDISLTTTFKNPNEYPYDVTHYNYQIKNGEFKGACVSGLTPSGYGSLPLDLMSDEDKKRWLNSLKNIVNDKQYGKIIATVYNGIWAKITKENQVLWKELNPDNVFKK